MSDIINILFPLAIVALAGLVIYLKFGKQWLAERKKPAPLAEQIVPTLRPEVRVAQVAVSSLPDNTYSSIEALLLHLRALNFTHQVQVDGHLVWPIGAAGFGPPLSYALIAGTLVRVNQGDVVPVPLPPVPPVPQPPAPPMIPPLTPDEIRAHVGWYPPFHLKQDGEKFQSHEARHAWVRDVLNPPGTGTSVEPAPVYVDPSAWTAENWAWFGVQGYEVLKRVDQQRWIDMVQGFGPGGKYFDPNRQQIKPDNI